MFFCWMLQVMDNAGANLAVMENTQTCETLREAHTRYMAEISPTYDAVLNEVAQRIQESGSTGKADIGALLFWKRPRADTPWVRNLRSMTDKDSRDSTKKAVSAVNDDLLAIPEAAGIGRAALSPLPGFERGDALASAATAGRSARAHGSLRPAGSNWGWKP